ncbi:hypothetical protein ACFX13_019351 [Malus domestica]
MVLLQKRGQDMQSTQSCYPKQISFPKGQRVLLTNNIYNKNFFKPKSKAEAKVIAAKKHSESEKRRRMRINSQYTTLRAILPDLIKMDKASVLGETVRKVRELKKALTEVEAACHCGDRRDECVLPGGVDKLSVEQCEGEKGGLVKATFSCEDRLGLISDMTRALSCVKGRVVRAEMVTVGGRSKNALWVQGLGGGNEGVVALKRALKVVIDRPVLPRNII